MVTTTHRIPKGVYLLAFPDRKTSAILQSKFNRSDFHLTLLVCNEDAIPVVEPISGKTIHLNQPLQTKVVEHTLLPTRIPEQFASVLVLEPGQCKQFKQQFMNQQELKKDVYGESQIFHITIEHAEKVALQKFELSEFLGTVLSFETVQWGVSK